MTWRGNFHDNPQTESFLKTLKAEAVHVTEFDNCQFAAADFPTFTDNVRIVTQLHSAL